MPKSCDGLTSFHTNTHTTLRLPFLLHTSPTSYINSTGWIAGLDQITDYCSREQSLITLRLIPDSYPANLLTAKETHE